jgi:hypothetical protein
MAQSISHPQSRLTGVTRSGSNQSSVLTPLEWAKSLTAALAGQGEGYDGRTLVFVTAAGKWVLMHDFGNYSVEVYDSREELGRALWEAVFENGTALATLFALDLLDFNPSPRPRRRHHCPWLHQPSSSA